MKKIQQQVRVQETISCNDGLPSIYLLITTGPHDLEVYPTACIWLSKLTRTLVFTEVKTQTLLPEDSQLKFLSIFCFLSKHQIWVHIIISTTTLKKGEGKLSFFGKMTLKLTPLNCLLVFIGAPNFLFNHVHDPLLRSH